MGTVLAGAIWSGYQLFNGNDNRNEILNSAPYKIGNGNYIENGVQHYKIGRE